MLKSVPKLGATLKHKKKIRRNGMQMYICTGIRVDIQEWNKAQKSHTSRRSGATNLYKLGVLSNMEMRSITGHQSEKVFESYIRVGLSEQAQIVAEKILAAKKARS